VSDDRAIDHGPFGLFELESVVKADGRMLHLYTWPDARDPGGQATDAEPPTPHDAEDQPGV